MHKLLFNSLQVVSCPVQPRARHWSCVFWRDFSGVKRTCWTTGSWRSCLSLEVVSSIPAWSTIIYRFHCGFICVSLCQSIKIKPTNMCIYIYIYIYIYRERERERDDNIERVSFNSLRHIVTSSVTSCSILALVMACRLRHQAISWTNIDSSSVRPFGIHLRGQFLGKCPKHLSLIWVLKLQS